jgi:hypothetical protein
VAISNGDAVMKLTRRDVTATMVTAAIVVPYVGYAVRGRMPLIQDARGMAVTGLVVLVAWAIAIRGPFVRGALGRVAGILGVAALAMGVTAAWLESDLMLVPFVAAIVVLWVIRMPFAHGLPNRTSHPAA